MESNTKYTAKEILNAVGFDKTEDIFGKMRVRIGGISGIVTPDYVIRVPSGATELEVIVGIELKTLKIKGESEEPAISDLAKEVIVAEGKVDAEKAEVRMAEKAEARAKAEAEAKKTK